MKLDAHIQAKFNELEQAGKEIKVTQPRGGFLHVDIESWHQWSTSAQSLLNIVFGSDSVYDQNFRELYDHFKGSGSLDAARGVFQAAKEDYENGYISSLEVNVSGEILGELLLLAKQSSYEGYKDVAAVLVCAILEDALKKYARTQVVG